MSVAETMPLIADECYSANKIQNCHPRTCCAEAQRDADMIWHKAKEKEWREKEADFLRMILKLPFFEFVLQVKEREQKLRKGEGK